MGYAKLAFAMMKCFPQLYWNYHRKSTVGWSIINILLDLIGGIFSFVSAALSRSNGLNLSKIILGAFSVAIDLAFAFQHYCLYPKKNR
jgi:cystinosin